MTDAEEASRAWGGSLGALVAARENEIHAMRVDGIEAALRLHRPGYQSAAAIRAELDWCARLAARGMPVPAPLPLPDGTLLLRLTSGRFASAVRWIDGSPMGRAGEPLAGPPAAQAELHRRLGRLLRRLHRETDALGPLEPFPRPAWDRDGLTGPAPVWGRFWEHPLLGPEEARILTRARDVLRERLALPGDSGPIHADVLRENVLVAGDAVALIDFDDSGTGPRLYDLGTVLSQNQSEPARDLLRDALMDGYGCTDTALVEMMTLARCCASVGWVVPRLPPQHPVHRSHIARAVAVAARVTGA